MRCVRSSIRPDSCGSRCGRREVPSATTSTLLRAGWTTTGRSDGLKHLGRPFVPVLFAGDPPLKGLSASKMPARTSTKGKSLWAAPTSTSAGESEPRPSTACLACSQPNMTGFNATHCSTKPLHDHGGIISTPQIIGNDWAQLLAGISVWYSRGCALTLQLSARSGWRGLGSARRRCVHQLAHEKPCSLFFTASNASLGWMAASSSPRFAVIAGWVVDHCPDRGSARSPGRNNPAPSSSAEDLWRFLR